MPAGVVFAHRGNNLGDRTPPETVGGSPWLTRYLVEPDKMRVNKDPIALELAKRYKVLMPNLQLTQAEVLDLVDYLEAHGKKP